VDFAFERAHGCDSRDRIVRYPVAIRSHVGPGKPA
jgi:hypothetical protein